MKITIYAIVGVDDEEQQNLYIGSTTNFKKRNLDHKSKCNNPNSKAYNKPLYQFIRNNGGWDNFIIEELKSKEVKNKQEALELEREYIELMNATLNKQIPGKYLELGQKEYIKQHREENKEYYKQQMKIINYKKIVCPYCNCEFTKGNKSSHFKSLKHQQNHINNLN